MPRTLGFWASDVGAPIFLNKGACRFRELRVSPMTRVRDADHAKSHWLVLLVCFLSSFHFLSRKSSLGTLTLLSGTGCSVTIVSFTADTLVSPRFHRRRYHVPRLTPFTVQGLCLLIELAAR